MELRIKPFPKNSYPKKGLLIKGSSPFIWLHEMEILGIDLNQIQSFPIPSNEPNILYGCFLIFDQNIPTEIGKNSYFQCFDNKLFIPENTIFYPKINPEDWQNIDAEYLIMHPEFGLVKLSEQIDWISLIQDTEKPNIAVRKPSNGVKIPQKIESYTVEMDDEKILEALQKPQTEEEWMKNLPFDMKKVMAGNKKEIEKYLLYIEKYPERAVELGVPLDIMGTSRGNGFGKFKFGDNWFGRLFGKNDESSTRSGKNYQWIIWVFLIVTAIARSTFNSNKEKYVVDGQSAGKVMNKLPENTVAFESGVTEIDMKVDSMYGRERVRLMNSYKEAISKPSAKKWLPDIEKDIKKFNTKQNTARDSLKTIYSKKITKHIESRSENIKRKISDSLKKVGSGKPANEGIVRSIWHKKKVLMADSLGRLYGTLDFPPMRHALETTTDVSSKENDAKKDVSFVEIIWLIIFMTGAVGLYSFVLKKKSMNIGGGNLPTGIKVFLMIVLLAMLMYIFYPLIESFGYNWFVWILIISVILLLYRLFAEDKSILKSDENE
ncbi:hypothetical protein A0O34_04775 [Chryseobacterium glaciei]|uniref:MoxR-vWA-beta-propeller ternary system domain-containing protein n=1 Tax=Chryseobacterium glaciei TaxID=1685010 RepID=A0A172XSA6_9FLAO|nr:hypothetical protein [Chryseobacterium glaciei]ANF49883.1 hypothetical protein A0O34_04775 [Chryseobacterium glaciei]